MEETGCPGIECWMKVAHRVCKRLVSSQPELEHLLLHVELGVLPLAFSWEENISLCALWFPLKMEGPDYVFSFSPKF